MNSTETSLLQFVALSLPAVAILMQAIVSLQQNSQSNVDKTDSLQTEFRLIELSFIGLVIAGALFGLSLYGTLSSIEGKIGLVLMILSLGLVAPATWFALRRSNVSHEKYDSPEEIVISGSKRVAVVLLPLLAVVFLQVTGFTFNLPIEELISTGTIRNTLLIVTTSVISFIFVRTYISVRHSIDRLRKMRVWNSNVIESMEEYKNIVPDDPVPSNQGETVYTSLSFEELRSNLNKLIENSPQDANTSKLETLSDNINSYLEKVGRWRELNDNIRGEESRLSTIKEEIEEYGQKRDNIDDEEARLDLEVRIQDLRNEMMEIKSRIEEGKNKKKKVETDLRNLVEKINKDIEEVESEASSTEFTTEITIAGLEYEI